ncbi:MAG: alpha-galactosidase [Mangrovibacterium sp.]
MQVISTYGGQEKKNCILSCTAKLENDILTLENNLISRRYKWNKGNLISISIEDKEKGNKWDLTGKDPDISLFGTGELKDGNLTVNRKAETSVCFEYLEVSVTTLFENVQILRQFRIYPDCPAIACDLYLKGKTEANWQGNPANLGDLRNVEGAAAVAEGKAEAVVMERVSLPGVHWRIKAVEFFDITDRNNNLVAEVDQFSYRAESRLKGNLLFASEILKDKGIFILKEAPPSSVQLSYPGFDYVVKTGDVKVCGIGVQPQDINESCWTRCYGFVTGVTSNGEYGALTALRRYQERVRKHLPERDNMIMMNTWGDRNQDKSVSEKFILDELEAAKCLGITHFQIDDGWQIGRSASSAFGGSLKKIWENPDYWKLDRKKFPNGLQPVMELGKKLGIEICLWFNPSTDNSYAHWKNDAETLINLFKEYGIRIFKIDGVLIPDKQADINLRKMFDAVMEATKNQVVFNLDVTSGRRFGYHYFNEYGNIFLENRYTDWANYYPHWTLRNLWKLSRYMPAQNLQIEFLNNSRNADKYPDGDILAPSKISFEYEFAITMMAQPLAWMEATALPDSAFRIAPVIKKYQQIQEDIQTGRIFPIGNEPDGTSWTGFQSDNGDNGYLLIFREYNQNKSEHLQTFIAANTKVKLTKVLGYGEDYITDTAADGRLSFSLPCKNSYVLYKYQIIR